MPALKSAALGRRSPIRLRGRIASGCGRASTSIDAWRNAALSIASHACDQVPKTLHLRDTAGLWKKAFLRLHPALKSGLLKGFFSFAALREESTSPISQVLLSIHNPPLFQAYYLISAAQQLWSMGDYQNSELTIAFTHLIKLPPQVLLCVNIQRT